MKDRLRERRQCEQQITATYRARRCHSFCQFLALSERVLNIFKHIFPVRVCTFSLSFPDAKQLGFFFLTPLTAFLFSGRQLKANLICPHYHGHLSYAFLFIY